MEQDYKVKAAEVIAAGSAAVTQQINYLELHTELHGTDAHLANIAIQIEMAAYGLTKEQVVAKLISESVLKRMLVMKDAIVKGIQEGNHATGA
jgi:hypothetical protein